MELTADEAWARILESARAALPQQPFHTWLASTRALALTSDLLVVAAPSDFAVEWIEAKYGETLGSVAKRILGDAFQLAFEARPSGDSADPTQAAPPLLADLPQEGGPAAPAPAGSEAMRVSVIGTLLPRFTLETYVVGNNNRLAVAACEAVAKAPGRSYNPLFIHGGVGLGKTHLLHGIANAVLVRHRSTRVAYLPSEQFTNELITAIQTRTTSQFHSRYRSIDLLLVDDVQFLAGKGGTQEEFFHTFNALYDAQKQIVMTSDRPPHEIPQLQERLTTRFQWGLVTDVGPPDFETRMAILQMKAKREGIDFPDAVLALIAEECRSSVRELEGGLIKLLAFASFTHREITLDFARQVIGKASGTPGHTTPDQIESVVAEAFGISVSAMQSKSRRRSVTEPRQVAMYLEKTLLQLPYTQIGHRFGGRDHSTVIHSIHKVEAQLEQDPTFKAKIDAIRRRLS